MIQQCDLLLPSFSKGFHLITRKVEKCLQDSFGALPETGLLNLFILHTSAGLAVSENADPAVRTDLNAAFDRIAPESSAYIHADEGPDDMPAHVKAVVVGSTVTVPITGGRLRLGTWQGLSLCEFRAQPQKRKIVLTLHS
ncbi:MAG: YjbQ family protein [Methylotenera sp.]|nr:YjbQ family protein [Oligoflexia bacterium]